MFQIHPPFYSPAFTPLAPRNPNTCPYMSMSSTKPSLTPTSNSKPSPRYGAAAGAPARRSTPQNPMLKIKAGAGEQQQQRRREAYLGKVRRKQEEGRWEGRSEMILRAEFLERKRAWEEERKKEGAEVVPSVLDEEEEEEEVDGDGNAEGEEVEMVDRILSQEEEEFEALVERMEEQRRGTGEGCERPETEYERQENEHEMSDYGSDDEEWDRLFREVVDTQDSSVGETGEGWKIDKGGDGDGGMDMS